jgi:carboxypeptidase C (cathepsin A)
LKGAANIALRAVQYYSGPPVGRFFKRSAGQNALAILERSHFNGGSSQRAQSPSRRTLFGESYGTPRTCVLTWLLHEDGVDLNGIVLQSSILDYGAAGSPVGLLPTFAADAWFHGHPRASLPPEFMKQVEAFARDDYPVALAAFPRTEPKVVKKLSDFLRARPRTY